MEGDGIHGAAKEVFAPGVGCERGVRQDGRLPRSQVGTNPQHLLITLLGDYWYGRTEHLPSAALVELLAEFDISEPSARAALNRLTKRGLLLSSKRGRNTYCGVNPARASLLKGTFSRVIAFGTHESRAWDGKWTIVAFSIPETQRQLRHAVRTNLRWLGYAALYDGLWCSPWDDQDAVLAKLSELDVGSTTVMRATSTRAAPYNHYQAGTSMHSSANTLSSRRSSPPSSRTHAVARSPPHKHWSTAPSHGQLAQLHRPRT